MEPLCRSLYFTARVQKRRPDGDHLSRLNESRLKTERIPLLKENRQSNRADLLDVGREINNTGPIVVLINTPVFLRAIDPH